MLSSVEKIISEINILLSENDRSSAIVLAQHAGEQGLDIPINQWLNWISDSFFIVNGWPIVEWHDAILAAPTTSDAISALKLISILYRDVVAPEELISSIEEAISSDLGHLLMGICYWRLRRWVEALKHLDAIQQDTSCWYPSLLYRVGCLAHLKQWEKIGALRRENLGSGQEFDWVILNNTLVDISNEYSYDLAAAFLDWQESNFPEIADYMPKIPVNRAFMEMLSSQPDVPRLLAESRKYAEKIVTEGTFSPSFENIRSISERARIGYFWSFGGIFQDLPVLKYSNQSRYETFLYYGMRDSIPDSADRSLYDNLFKFCDMTEENIFEKVKSDNLDALIVLDNVGYYSHDEVIARKPSKRIAYYGNVFYPTFMPAVDALILPERLIEPMAALGGDEVLLSIPDGLHLSGHSAFRIFDPLPLPPGPPVIGSVASFFKMNRRWFGRVKRILDAVPEARLRLDMTTLVDQEILRILELIKDAGIDHRRVDIHRAFTNINFRGRMAPLWIAIDTTPFSCYYTALQALSTGLPILSVPETLPTSHLAASVLEAIGADLLICRDEQALIDKAVMLLTHPELLANLRSMVAEDVRASLFADLPTSAKIWDQTVDKVLALPVRA